MVKSLVLSLNGITIAYMMGTLNSFLSVLLAFGVDISDKQAVSLVGFMNGALVTLMHLSHRLGESENQRTNAPPPLNGTA